MSDEKPETTPAPETEAEEGPKKLGAGGAVATGVVGLAAGGAVGYAATNKGANTVVEALARADADTLKRVAQDSPLHGVAATITPQVTALDSAKTALADLKKVAETPADQLKAAEESVTNATKGLKEARTGAFKKLGEELGAFKTFGKKFGGMSTGKKAGTIGLAVVTVAAVYLGAKHIFGHRERIEAERSAQGQSPALA